jgi:diguanylate cyclase (GGDEF)-like protein
VAVNQALTDPLTSLANRRAFMAAVDSEIARQRRYGGIFSLAVLDLDGFKALNDSRGHRAGDEGLQLVAAVLRSNTRQGDSVARIGGDEFAVLLPNTQDVDCDFLYRKLGNSVAERMAAGGFAVTASIGCKTFRQPPGSASNALQQADAIMYDAKMSGKNCVVHF